MLRTRIILSSLRLLQGKDINNSYKLENIRRDENNTISGQLEIISGHFEINVDSDEFENQQLCTKIMKLLNKTIRKFNDII